MKRIAEAFETEYERLFGPGSALKDAGIELVDYGVDAIGVVTKPAAVKHTGGNGTTPGIRRKAFCPIAGEMIDTPIYEGAALQAGAASQARRSSSTQVQRLCCTQGTRLVSTSSATRVSLQAIERFWNVLNPTQVRSIDPVTFEVLNHRFMTISDEMGIQYMRCSGSNVLITGNDAAAAIMLADGSLVSVGPYIVTQGNVLPLIVDSTIKSLGPGEVIEDGDIFICNDPYLGAIHHPDIATVAPIFWKGKLVAWVGASGHQLDNGGMDPGGFSIKAVDTHQEGLRMPPVKIASRGIVRKMSCAGYAIRCAIPLSRSTSRVRSHRSIAVASVCSNCLSVGAQIRLNPQWSKASRVRARSWRRGWRIAGRRVA